MEYDRCDSRTERVHGLYQQFNKWRIVHRCADGSQQAYSFATEAAARTHENTLIEQIEGRTVSDAVQEFVVDNANAGCDPAP